MSRRDVSPIQGEETAVEALSPLFAVSVSFLIINTLFLLLRFYAVLFLRTKRLGLAWDDWFLIPAWMCTTGVIISGLTMYHWETSGRPTYGGHDSIHDLVRLGGVLKSIFALLQLLLPAYAFTRFSILALYLRVFTGRIVRMGSYFLVGFICCQWVAYAMAAAFQCTPVQYYWDKLLPNGHCVDINRLNRSFTPANIAADSIIIALPLPTIWKLDVSRLRKAGYTFVLGMGSFALAASVVRAATLEQNDTTNIRPAITNVVVEWLIIEPSLYFLTACLPTMHPFFRLLTPPSLRYLTTAKIAHARHRHSPALRNAGNSFERLHDADDNTAPHHVQYHGKAAEGLGGAGGVEPSRVQAQAEGGGMRLGAAGAGAVPLRDWSLVETGERIMVQTEIITTQEERIGEVMGF